MPRRHSPQIILSHDVVVIRLNTSPSSSSILVVADIVVFFVVVVCFSIGVGDGIVFMVNGVSFRVDVAYVALV